MIQLPLNARSILFFFFSPARSTFSSCSHPRYRSCSYSFCRISCTAPTVGSHHVPLATDNFIEPRCRLEMCSTRHLGKEETDLSRALSPPQRSLIEFNWQIQLGVFSVFEFVNCLFDKSLEQETEIERKGKKRGFVLAQLSRNILGASGQERILRGSRPREESWSRRREGWAHREG